MKIKVGNFDVLKSGSVHSNGNDPINFILADDMTVRLDIIYDKALSPSIEIRPDGSQVLSVRCINPASQLHFGPASPMEIGTIDGRKLFFLVRINVFGESTSYAADYTFLLGEAVDEL